MCSVAIECTICDGNGLWPSGVLALANTLATCPSMFCTFIHAMAGIRHDAWRRNDQEECYSDC